MIADDIRLFVYSMYQHSTLILGLQKIPICGYMQTSCKPSCVKILNIILLMFLHALQIMQGTPHIHTDSAIKPYLDSAHNPRMF